MASGGAIATIVILAIIIVLVISWVVVCIVMKQKNGFCDIFGGAGKPCSCAACQYKSGAVEWKDLVKRADSETDETWALRIYSVLSPNAKAADAEVKAVLPLIKDKKVIALADATAICSVACAGIVKKNDSKLVCDALRFCTCAGDVGTAFGFPTA